MIHQVSCQQRVKEITEIFRFWIRIRGRDFYFNNSHFECVKSMQKYNPQWHMLQDLYEFSLRKAYGEDISEQFEERLLSAIYESSQTESASYTEMSSIYF